MNETKAKLKWYQQPLLVVVALLLFGPLALPLVWATPVIEKRHKLAVTIIAIMLLGWVVYASFDLYRTIGMSGMEF